MKIQIQHQVGAIIITVFLCLMLFHVDRFTITKSSNPLYPRYSNYRDVNRNSTFYRSNRFSLPEERGKLKDHCTEYAKSPIKKWVTPKRTHPTAKGIFVCDKLMPIDIPKWDDVPPFQMVFNHQLWIKSAYFDTRHRARGLVRIIGISSTRFDMKNLHCTVWYDKCQKVMSTKAIAVKTGVVIGLAEFKHIPFFFTCETVDNIKPDYISLSMKPCDNAANLLDVHPLIDYPQNKPSTLGACLHILHAVYDPYRLLEWLALHRILGVDHVFIYDTMSVSDSVQSIINYYRSINYVTIVRWSLEEGVSVRAYGHRAMLNDCSYRNYGRFKYMISYDFDEYLIPQKIENIKTFADQKLKDGFSVMSIARSNFCMNRNAARLSLPVLHTMSYTSYANPGSLAAPKVLYKPESVQEVGIHMVTIRTKGAKQYNTPPSEALVHHYRYWETMMPHCQHKNSVILRYKTKLTADMNTVLKYLGLPLIN